MNPPEPRLCVYVVEDSTILLKRIVEMLESIARVVVVGYSASAVVAIEEIETLRPDLLIVDIAIQSGTGFDVLRAVKRRLGNDAPISIVLTNHASVPYRNAAARLGASHFFDKSSEILQFVTAVQDLAGNRDKRNGSGG